MIGHTTQIQMQESYKTMEYNDDFQTPKKEFKNVSARKDVQYHIYLSKQRIKLYKVNTGLTKIYETSEIPINY